MLRVLSLVSFFGVMSLGIPFVARGVAVYEMSLAEQGQVVGSGIFSDPSDCGAAPAGGGCVLGAVPAPLPANPCVLPGGGLAPIGTPCPGMTQCQAGPANRVCIAPGGWGFPCAAVAAPACPNLTYGCSSTGFCNWNQGAIAPAAALCGTPTNCSW
jgi:hypothetical protein